MRKLEKLLSENILIAGVYSNPRKKNIAGKLTIRPIVIQNRALFQVEALRDNKAYHQNLDEAELLEFMLETCRDYKQIQLYTAANDFTILVNKKGDLAIKRSDATKKVEMNKLHNKEKNYILNPNTSAEFFISLGIMDENGRVKPSKYDKFKQINKYIEIVANVIDELKLDFYRIVDFGCGKSYLTFALYHFLTQIRKKEVEIIGLDLKADVIEFCDQLAKKLNYDNLKFQVGDIGKYTSDKAIDIVISLHACNTATDFAIDKGIRWKAKAILAVPCCHHEAYTQIENAQLNGILKHGILKEKIASLVTDGLRATLLEAFSYKVAVIEFIDSSHTPKNILIKAILLDAGFNSKVFEEYQQIADMLGLNLTLAKLIDK
ncbi:class I SAM-dependent methyltransferase [Candidatus Epulonipiscium viviparus]|uniref:class I SAM-dependent methyltransferase n=1 Tax=Candidatus Epulonipiscium viviparus TaxID=420336 RepID=UPI002738081C|nr:SAM-dependent methyltransferase [Candidatus Epulopiscium viviparus]